MQHYNNRSSLAVILIAIVLINFIGAATGNNLKALDDEVYTIATTWDNKTTPDNASISLTFSVKCDTSNVKNLFIEIDAPFYNDPKAPENASTSEPFPGLWDYEVVEAFFLGNNEEYLEIELAPSGHYLLYYLTGVRNVTNDTLPLTDYKTEILNGTRWHGEAYIPLEYFPKNVTKFNAYAIHNSDPNRVYMSLFPVDSSIYPNQTEPNFHFLDAFAPIDFGNELDAPYNCTVTSTTPTSGTETTTTSGTETTTTPTPPTSTETSTDKNGSGHIGFNLWIVSSMIFILFWQK